MNSDRPLGTTVLADRRSILSERPGGVRWLGSLGRRTIRQPSGLLGVVLVLLIGGLALFAGQLTPHEPFKAVASPLLAPSTTYPMGTDDLGRDLWTEVLYGARTSLLAGLGVAAIATLLGLVMGSLSAYHGGRVDDLLMRLTEFFQTMPRFFLAVLAIALFGATLANVILVLGLTSWTMIARIVRAEMLSWKEREFILATIAVGTGPARILFRHLLPNVLPSTVTTATLLAGQAILVEAGLSFLGLGDPNVTSLGTLLNQAQSFMRVAWWMAFFPGLFITLVIVGINLAGDGLNDALRPSR